MADLERLTRRRGAARANVTRAITAAQQLWQIPVADLTQANITNLQARKKNLKTALDNLAEMNDEIHDTMDIEDLENDFQRCQDYEINVAVALESIDDCLAAYQAHHNPPGAQANQLVAHPPADNHLKLPKLELPSFSGSYTEWTAFIDLFNGSVHNQPNLNNSQKLFYLKGLLKGEAAKLISTLTVTDGNYQPALDILRARYDNQRAIVREHISGIVRAEPVKMDSCGTLRRLFEGVHEHRLALRALGQHVEEMDQFFIFHVVEKLDPESRKQWELAHPGTDLQTYDQLSAFLRARCQALEASQGPKQQPTSKLPLSGNKQKGNALSLSSQKCLSCSEQHQLFNCDKFKSLKKQERRNFVQEKKLCFNCLRSGHAAKECLSKSRCRECDAAHNTLLHIDRQSAGSNNAVFEPNKVLLQTAIVHVNDSKGHLVPCRALLDVGSQPNLITNKCRAKLNLVLSKSEQFFTTAGNNSASALGSCDLTIVSKGKSFALTSHVVQGELAAEIPAYQFSKPKSILPKMKLADPKFNQPAGVDLILGAQYYETFRTGGRKVIDSLSFTNTVFGWVASGVVDNEDTSAKPLVSTCVSTDSALKKFWELEEIPSVPQMTEEERLTEEHFKKTTYRDKNGRFVVKLPWSISTPPLGESRQQAVKRFLSQERKMQANQQFKVEYKAFIQELFDMKHLEEVPENEINSKCSEHYYMPHHAVFKESTTTKLRVVMDASAKTSTGVSLNDKLMIGPKIQDSVFDLLLRFRMHQIGLTADVAKMYRQVVLHPEDRDFCRIVWRESPDQPLKDYRFTVVIYGIASSCYHAVRSVNELGQKTDLPTIKVVILRDLYVDDLNSGAETTAEGEYLQDNIMEVLSSGGFDLRKWVSNDPNLINRLPERLRGVTSLHHFDSGSSIKTLGVAWDPLNDCFKFKVTLGTQSISTKQQLVSECSKIFDPVGWLAPIVIIFKLLMQQTWVKGLDWHSELPEELKEDFYAARNELTQLNNFKMPRIALLPAAKSIELHVFSDASQLAYAAAIYIVSEDDNGCRKSMLLTSKTRVAPLNTVSLPRLELCAAHLGTKLLKLALTSLESLHLPIKSCFGWSDSMITLAWISSLPVRWNTFVANRVSQIQSVLEPSQWNHVSSKNNPADIASRGTTMSILNHHPLWWGGPAFLELKKDEWPTRTADYPAEIPEERKTTKSIVSTITCLPSLLSIESFSSFPKLISVLSTVIIFLQKLFKKVKRPSKTIENLDAKVLIVHLIQEKAYGAEIQQLIADKRVSKSSKLCNLSPFLDEKGILRVGGRIYQSDYPEEAKHPIVLPPDSHLSKLLILHHHLETLHGGIQATLYSLRQEYWIVHAVKAVKKVIHSCKTCFVFDSKAIPPPMGPLPEERITDGRVFENVGIDFAGPFYVKAKPSMKTTEKTYMAVFICFATKTVHLEMVTSLTKDACILALKRFIARRNLPSTMFSDNGTNFVGARNELLQLRGLLSDEGDQSLSKFASQKGMQWVMIPPRSPHFGGLWEAAVKSAKNHLKRVIGKTVLTYEEFQTVLAQIESVLNSRPISPMSSDPNDLLPLSPAHFLVGQQLNSLPEKTMQKLPEDLPQRYERTKAIVQHFWNRWKREYINNLQQTTKWYNKPVGIERGDLVLLTEENVAPLSWPTGRITELYLGNDGVPRVAKVFTGKTNLIRPLVKLRVLPKLSVWEA